MIAAGREKQVEQVLDYVATIVPEAAPEPLGETETASEKDDSGRESS